ncbi:MAG: cysteine desulfurase [Fimbriimonadales bacterium]|nr:MAG: cysteine desulfurase [Fimbriimonadales bacterium]
MHGSHQVEKRLSLDIEAVRSCFPALAGKARGKPLVYLDNGATTQKPLCVIEAVAKLYREGHGNVHRGVHDLSERTTQQYENARIQIAAFLNARDAREIVFVRGATEAINLVAHSYVEPRLQEGDAVLVTEMEHHSNIVPWQLVCERKGAELLVVPVRENGELDADSFRSALSDRVKFCSIAHVSNVLGTVNPIKHLVALCHEAGIPVLVDGAQAAPRMRVDVQEIGADFYAISGHKMYGPTGIGVLYGKYERLAEMIPYQGGGDMITEVRWSGSKFQAPPHRFEAGTPNIAGAIGLAAAVEYLESLGMDAVESHERDVVEYGAKLLRGMPRVRLIGDPLERAGAISFVIEGVHPHDAAALLDAEGIAVRAGHHCAQPLMERYGVPATVRASVGLYNTRSEMDALAHGLRRVLEVFP